MLIGIDASRSVSAQRTGTESYSLHLVRGLLALGSEHRFRLYFNRPPVPGLFPAGGEERSIPFPRLWTHARLSWEMLTRRPDVLFVPSHVLPLVHPRRSVATVHDLGYEAHPEAHPRLQRLYLRWSTRFNARAAARVVADSEATRQDLIRLYGTAPDKVVVVYPGRDEALKPVAGGELLAAVRVRYGLPGPYLLYVGTLQPRKNLIRLVEAFAAVREDLEPSLRLVLAGRAGWLADDLLERIEQLRLSEQVLLPGYVPAEDLPALLNGALAFVYPSLYEGFGLPVLEAMACGTPVVCSNRSSLPEVAGDAAVQVDPVDTRALAEALRRVSSDAALRRDLVGRGLARVQRFSWKRCAAEVLRVLEEVGAGVG